MEPKKITAKEARRRLHRNGWYYIPTLNGMRWLNFAKKQQSKLSAVKLVEQLALR